MQEFGRRGKLMCHTHQFSITVVDRNIPDNVQYSLALPMACRNVHSAKGWFVAYLDESAGRRHAVRLCQAPPIQWGQLHKPRVGHCGSRTCHWTPCLPAGSMLQTCEDTAKGSTQIVIQLELWPSCFLEENHVTP